MRRRVHERLGACAEVERLLVTPVLKRAEPLRRGCAGRGTVVVRLRSRIERSGPDPSENEAEDEQARHYPHRARCYTDALICAGQCAFETERGELVG